jgi:predicted alpha-1,2-mannosidase
MNHCLHARTHVPSDGRRASALFNRWPVFVCLALAFASACAQNAPRATLASKVNPFVGTGGDPDDGIDTFPGAVRPFGMVQLSPDTEDHGFGYHYIHKWIKGFSMTHMSGAGCANEGDVFFTATTGPTVTRIADMQTPYSHRKESATPGYYQVQLLQWGIHAELTATERTGVARFTFPAGKPANILVPISHTLNQTASASVRVVGDRRIEGFVEDHAFCNKTPTYKVHFVMLFDRPFSSHGVWQGDQYDGPAELLAGGRQASQSTHDGNTGAYAIWAASERPQTVSAKIGISYVDLDGAEKNLAAEAAREDFDTIRRSAEEEWNRELGAVQVSGGASGAQRVFYTALYHSLLMPSLFDDADGRYLGFDGRLHAIPAGHHVYTNFSGWDIYRSEVPLLALIEPQRMQDMAESVVLMYEQGGWIDRWPQINLYTNDMVGSPLTILLATAWLSGLRGFDIGKGWEGMWKDATEAPPSGRPYTGQEGVEWMNTLHYLPADKVDYGTVAKTQEYTLAYAALYRLALSLGKHDEARRMHERALYHRNLFNREDYFFRPRNADGTWAPDFNPALDGHGFVEGTAWHYQTFAPADLAWLVNAVGRDRLNARLTEFFQYPDPGWYGQFYNPYNETDLQAPYVFHFSGRPYESQRVVRRVLTENYFDAPDGIPGNDDGGAMSSWAVLNMMGIYTVDPTSLAYELVSPTFPKIVIHLSAPYAGTSFTITTTASPQSTPYIQNVLLNGKEHTHNWVAFRDISSGGTMHYFLGSMPDKQWGASLSAAPPSLKDSE